MTTLLAVQQAAQHPGPGSAIAQACLYFGIVSLIGVGVGAFIFDNPPRAVLRFLPVAWTVAMFSALAVSEMRRRALSVGLGPFLETRLGIAALWRVTGLVVAHEGMLVALLARRRARRFGLALMGLGGAITAAAHASSSHAAAGGWSWLKVGQQAAHIVAVGAWIGGLAVLLLGTRGSVESATTAAMKRFSAVAGISIFVVGATGFMRACQEIATPAALVSTTYGRLVILKTQLLIALAVAGTENRYRNVAAGNLRGLQRLGTAELGIAMVVFAVTGVLSGTVPAREAHAQSTLIKVVRATSSLEGDTLVTTVLFSDRSTLQMYCEPARPGLNECHLTFFDAQGREKGIRKLTLVAHLGDRTQPVIVRRFSKGHFVADIELTPGEWRLEGSVGATEKPTPITLPLSIKS